MNVAQLIALLQALPQTLPVAYKKHSEQCLMEPQEIEVVILGTARPDGWIPDKRSNNGAQYYVLFPGN